MSNIKTPEDLDTHVTLTLTIDEIECLISRLTYSNMPNTLDPEELSARIKLHNASAKAISDNNPATRMVAHV